MAFSARVRCNVFWWRVGWAWWFFAAVTLVWFMAVLAARRGTWAALGLSAGGLLFDAVGDAYWIIRVDWDRTMFLIGAAGANTLYSLGVLSAGLQIGERRWTMAVAAAGLGFSALALTGWRDGILVSSGATILLYCAWCPIVAKSSSSEATGSSAA